MEGWTMIFSLKDEGLLHRIPPSRRLFPLLLAVPFVGFLAGSSEPDQTNARNAATNTTASIQMPPAIVASHTYRCVRSEEHTSELQSLMRTSYAVFCLKKKKTP